MGELENARSLFDEMPEKNVVMWTGMIDGLVHCYAEKRGLIAFDIRVAKSIIDTYAKYMLTRLGRLEEAEILALEIPTEIANVMIWRTLLGDCSFHDNIEMSERGGLVKLKGSEI
ncbi:unnamed protein product [Linum tenue]|uniref:Pentatricopeptide repeat-containing protein n=1 Tax=Linum tenue TaxID=586396 RepID=A0AAV0LH39_9ROSI|nr:unnamed protein product [Linum tenue]